MTVLELGGASLSDVQTMKIDIEDVDAPDTLTIGRFSDASGLAAMMTGFGRDSDQAGFTGHVTARTGWTEVTDRGGGVVVTNGWIHVATSVPLVPPPGI